jgi:hypothetical protein
MAQIVFSFFNDLFSGALPKERKLSMVGIVPPPSPTMGDR